jgi:hypothetical protein
MKKDRSLETVKKAGGGVAEGDVLDLVLKVAVHDPLVHDPLPAPGGGGEQAAAQVMLIEVGGDVLGVGAALENEPLAVGQDGHLVVGPVGEPDELGAVRI